MGSLRTTHLLLLADACHDRCGTKELKFIERSGAYFGFIFGLIQAIVWFFVPEWCGGHDGPSSPRVPTTAALTRLLASAVRRAGG